MQHPVFSAISISVDETIQNTQDTSEMRPQQFVKSRGLAIGTNELQGEWIAPIGHFVP